MKYEHGACGASWTGLKRSHCSACHLTFNSLHSFDYHQTWTDGELACSTKGLVEKGGIYATPGRD